MILNSYQHALQDLKQQHFSSTQELFKACEAFILCYQQEKIIQHLILSQFNNAFSQFDQHPQGIKILKRFFFILLEQYIDFHWYKTYPTYQNEWSIKNDKRLFALKFLHKKYHIFFQYSLLKEGKLHRYYNAIRKRVYSLLQNPASHTIGMRTGFCKLEILALLNEINEEISKDYGKVIKLQINSIIRTQQHQQHLANLGYIAAKISSHPTGYAIDIERSWYLLHNKKLFLVIEKILKNYQQKNIINLIDEGIIWHICLNPDYISEYQSKIHYWKKQK